MLGRLGVREAEGGNRVLTTRLAPSPTGALHLGNARTFLINWALARQNGWRVVLRVEDLDGPRIKPGAAAGIERTLRWLGMDWDAGPVVQSADLTPYEGAMQTLARAGRAYPTEITRGEADDALSAPQEGGAGGEKRFPASLRPAGWGAARVFSAAGAGAGAAGVAWQFATPDVPVEFVDGFAGQQCINPAQTIGDFVVWTKRGVPAYQLAVVVDDARQGVTHVVRGDDLLDSAARQWVLYEALGLGAPPVYVHVPLVVGSDGRRLAKRHGDTRVDVYRDSGVPAERVIGLVAWWCGITTSRGVMNAIDFAAGLRVDRLPRGVVVFTQEDDQWLREV